jgi:hypothetical protein
MNLVQIGHKEASPPSCSDVWNTRNEGTVRVSD